MPKRRQNPPTVADPVSASSQVRRPPASFRTAFERAFASLTVLWTGLRSDGLLAVAVLEGAPIAHLHAPLGSGPTFFTVGRHDRCDLRLHRDDQVSLRHVVVAARRTANGELRLRLFDLHTGKGLLTESGERCEALAADGPLFITIGRYCVFLLPTGRLAGSPWNASAGETWDAFPERVVLDRRSPGRSAEVAKAPASPVRRRRITTAQVVQPPGLLRRRPPPGDRGRPVGYFDVSSDLGRERVELCASDFQRGVLVGRYRRCAFGCSDERLSRVHLLLVEDGGELWAVDTGSTHGTSTPEAAVRQVELRPGTVVHLAGVLTLAWHRYD